MSLFTILDEINQTWEADKAAEAEYKHLLDTADERRRHSLFYDPPVPQFPKVAAECFHHINYRIKHAKDTTMMEEWMKNPHDEGMLGFLRAIIHMDDPEVEVINSFFGHEHTSMMFSDITFTDDYHYHHLSWEDPPIGFTIERRVEYLHEFLNKANQLLNSNGMPSGEVRSETLDLLAKEWQKGCYSDRGNNPELLEMMVQRFYRNMSPVAYAVLHQAMTLTLLGEPRFPLTPSFSEPKGEPMETLEGFGVAHEFHIEPPLTQEQFNHENKVYAHYAKYKISRVGYATSVPARGDFHITTDKMWIRHNSKYYEIQPDYHSMGHETANVYLNVFHKVFRAIRNSYRL